VAMHSSGLKQNRMSFAARISPDERGQTTSEYAIILTLITAGILAAILLLATNLGLHITNVANLIP
jgi:Flp pilus assembly pilin Flp